MLLKNNNKGFTLIEVIVVAGIIAVLAGILVPIIFKEIDESKLTRAMADTKSISTALTVLKKDVGEWPVSANCNASATELIGAGDHTILTLHASWDGSIPVTYDNFLATNPGCWAAGIWKGPYMATVTKDPWGRPYVTNAADFLTDNPVWILSAGPDGTIDTAITDTTIPLDAKGNPKDIGIRLK